MKHVTKYWFCTGLIICTLLLHPYFVSANEKQTTIQLEQAKKLSHSKPDSAIRIFTQCIRTLQKEKSWKLYALAHLNLGILFAEQGSFENALAMADTAVFHSSWLKDLDLQSSAYNLQANILMQTGQNEAALRKFLSCISIAEKRKNTGMLIMVYSNVSMLYLNLLQYKKALEYGRKQHWLAVSANNRDEIAYSCAAIIDVFSQMKQTDSMEKYVNRMRWAATGTRDPSLAIMLANETGAMLNRKNRHKEAIPYFLKAAELSLKQNDVHGNIQSNLNAGLAYMYSGQATQALIVLKDAFKNAKAVGDRHLEKEAAKYLSEAYSKVSDFANAYKYQLHYQAISDQMLNKESQESIQKLEAKYQAEKRETAIRLLNKDNALKALELETRKDERNLVLISSLAILGFGLFFGNRFMALRKLATEKEVMENRLRLSADLHDDVGATLSSISIYTEAIKSKLKNNEPERVIELVNKIGENSRETISTLGDIVWNLNPINDSAKKLFNRMESTATLLLSAQNTGLDFHADPQLLELEFSLEAKQNLYLIFKETINNAAKYAEGSMVTVSINKIDNALEMKIEDNGKGFDVNQNSEGNGLRNIRLRTELLGGSARISSSGTGTITHIRLPLSGLGKE